MECWMVSMFSGLERIRGTEAANSTRKGARACGETGTAPRRVVRAASDRIRHEFRTQKSNREVMIMLERDLSRAPDELTASDIMTVAPLTCSPFSTVLEAVMIFRDADCGAVPIMENGKPVGIVTDRDIALALPEYPDLVNRPIKEIMTPGIVAIRPEDPLDRVCDALRAQAVRRIVVVGSDERLQGIIGWADIAPVLSERAMGRLVTDVIGPPK
jgi:CBS domain-containing protein